MISCKKKEWTSPAHNFILNMVLNHNSERFSKTIWRKLHLHETTADSMHIGLTNNEIIERYKHKHPGLRSQIFAP